MQLASIDLPALVGTGSMWTLFIGAGCGDDVDRFAALSHVSSQRAMQNFNSEAVGGLNMREKRAVSVVPGILSLGLGLSWPEIVSCTCTSTGSVRNIGSEAEGRL